MPKTATRPASSHRPGKATATSPPPAIEDVWRDYQRRPTEALRNRMVEHYTPLVHYVAGRVHARLPDQVDIDDLTSAGTFGLIDAIRSFNPDMGNKFQTYAAPRIRGAMLDWLRQQDWVPRLVRTRSAKVRKATMQLEMKYGRPPTEHEVAEAMGLSFEEYLKVHKDGRAVGVSSINRPTHDADGGRELTELDVLEETSHVNPFTAAQRKDLKGLIVHGLSRAERLIVVLYYYEQMTMREIGLALDLSESRVSQMHASILERMRASGLGVRHTYSTPIMQTDPRRFSRTGR